MKNRCDDLLLGAVAGAIATLPMSIVMLVGKRLLPWTKRDALPPTQIVRRATQAVGLHDDLEHEERLAVTIASHFGYGAATGSLYGAAVEPQSLLSGAATGVAYGLSVWSGSYLGLLPAMGLYWSALHDSRERNALMVAAHVVWGASLGIITSCLKQPSDK